MPSRISAVQLSLILAGAVILCSAAFINGYPLVFPDTGTYLRQALELRGAPDRPPYYSLFLFPLHARLTLWTIPVVQNLFTSYVLFRFLGLMFRNLTPQLALVVLILLTFFSALPWVSNEIMPDIFVPLIILICFKLMWFWENLHRFEHWLLIFGLTAMIAFHQGNVPLVLVLLVALCALGLLGAQSRRWFGRLGRVVLIPLAIGLAAQTLYGFALTKRVTPTPMGPIFLLARVVYDGPGRDYLDTSCPSTGYFLCGYRDQLTHDSDWFLWGDDTPLQTLIANKGEMGARDEASAIVSGTLRNYWPQQLAAALRNGVAQFFLFDLTDACPCTGRVRDIVTRHFPWELTAFETSLQNTGRLPWAMLSRIDAVVVVSSAFLLFFASIVRAQDFGSPSRIFLCYLLVALIANAFIMGALSGPTDRYQARVIWLVPMTAFGYAISVARLWSQGERPDVA